MSGSGLIYAAVLAAWAAYFVSRSVRSGSRESLAAPEGTVLRRRGAAEAPAGSYALLRPSASAAEPVVKPRRVSLAEALAPLPTPVKVPVGRATARRRRRALGTLVGLFLFVALLGLVGLLPGWAPALPALLVGGYLIELRVQVRRAQLAAQPRFVPAAPPVRRQGVLRRRDADESWDPWPSFEAVPGKVADLASGWEPRPVPLPTYVTAAKAETPPGRRIDMTAGGQWAVSPFAETQELPDIRPAAPAPAEESAAAENAEQEELEYELPRAAND
ncbi:MAG: hypothetical protein ACT4QG_00615 [Sporichthyaceae bacterium]